MTRLFGMDDEFGEDAILGRLEGMKDVIEQVNKQFKDPDMTTFVCVCIPEFLSLYETERLVQELAKFEIDTHNIIINQVIFDDEDVESKLLKARMKMQQKYIDQFYMLYDDFNITKLPLLPQEVTGVEALKSFSRHFLSPYQPLCKRGTVEDLERRISMLKKLKSFKLKIRVHETSELEKSIEEELIPKKVRFREGDGEPNNDMMVDLTPEQTISWRDKLVGQPSKDCPNGSERGEAFDILEGDIQKSVVNGIPSIKFSNRIFHFLIQGMENTVILKLLGRNIGFSVLQNKLYILWRPSATIHTMDIKNGYFLVKFQNKADCEKALFEGPWIIFRQYLTVQPWTVSFDPTQAFPSVVMAWIRFPGLPSYLYNHKIITEIGGMVGKVIKLDTNTDNKARGRFARMAVYIDLDKPLVSQILINGWKQNVEYESLPTICFQCGRYGHVESSCSLRNTGSIEEKGATQQEKAMENQNTTMDISGKKEDNFGP
ncbi:ATPase GET3 [Gossypium australe]|uniref:ATPase GET3 n=1 Tax=Gossypium australe TaxID=47621 RepID=A0A5B6VJX2_9ROSI|nr:ATPase GET3 [Gossypium australe]